jgi:hypothetical protein
MAAATAHAVRAVAVVGVMVMVTEAEEHVEPYLRYI